MSLSRWHSVDGKSKGGRVVFRINRTDGLLTI
jgi:hypothetical protein